MNLGGHEIQLRTMTRKSFITLLAKERGNWHSYVAGGAWIEMGSLKRNLSLFVKIHVGSFDLEALFPVTLQSENM